MSDEMRITSPVSIKTDSSSRVAYDLMLLIGSEIETGQDSQNGDKSNREYWLSLYRQCYKATQGLSLKHVLNRDDT